MDNFQKLPPELRIMILGYLHSQASLSRLIRASPTMLVQYTLHSAICTQDFLFNLAGNEKGFHDLVQDAVGLINLNEAAPNVERISQAIEQWVDKSFPNPFASRDSLIIAKIQRLLASTSEIIDDYLRKATAPSPRDAYLIPFRFTNIDSVDTNCFTLDDLSRRERYHLFRCFLKYEIFCKMYHPRVRLAFREARDGLGPRDDEGMACIHEYVSASYGQLFSQLSAKWALPDVDNCTGTYPNRPKKPMFPDSMCLSTERYLEDMNLCPQEPVDVRGWEKEIILRKRILGALSLMGFNLLLHLQKTTAKETGQDSLRSWFHSILSEWRHCYWDTEVLHLKGTAFFEPSWAASGGLWVHLLKEEPENDLLRACCAPKSGDGSIHKLALVQLQIYRQRGWVFFDDARLFSNLKAHFPTTCDLIEECNRVEYPPHLQECEAGRRRSALWQEYWAGQTRKHPVQVPKTAIHDELIDDDDGSKLPPFYDNVTKEKLTTFWRHAEW
ncbi:hypothetical protein FGRMN_3002 [Fusarium graminum]|nr:hypothetical protein FGRMN_3002 [Fusarium graminum]